ncbi:MULTISPECIES: hypothetical protein [Halomonas]|uniref:Uncharacterized protein n=2 Tax=Halomonas TaxID=2745 RepID=A0A7X4VYY9_9GAMM|nr:MULTISPECIES: hypothetical protein [Halomonas]MDR5903098.1 hypothetical protein [Halomonas icarae]NAW12922.1 hypothetical protein [Halomonas icarae]TDB04397.1 hypothetical protein E0702_04900 [Halomonas marinisediminis]
MTYSIQTTAKRPSNTPRACLAALDLTQEDLVRPELRDDVILAKRLPRHGNTITGRHDPLVGGHRTGRTALAVTSTNLNT